MSVVGTRVSVVAGTATLIVEADDDGTNALVTNAGTAAVDLGGTAVTSGSAYSLAAGASVAMDLYSHEKLYGVPTGGTVVMHVLKTSVS